MHFIIRGGVTLLACHLRVCDCHFSVVCNYVGDRPGHAGEGFSIGLIEAGRTSQWEGGGDQHLSLFPEVGESVICSAPPHWSPSLSHCDGL